MLDTREGFKAAFLLKCAQAGLSEGEISTLLDQALEKVASFGDVVSKPVEVVADRAGKALDWTALGLLGTAIAAPIGIGGAAGYGLAKLTDLNDEDPQETKVREQINEYQRLAEQARLNRIARLNQQQRPRTGRPVV